jgi:hypothetical protein
VEGVDDVREAEPHRDLGELSGIQFAVVTGAAGVQELALCRRALPVLDLQMLADGRGIRNRGLASVVVALGENAVRQALVNARRVLGHLGLDLVCISMPVISTRPSR